MTITVELNSDQKQTILNKFIGWLTTIAVLCMLNACAFGSRVVDHSFEFDMFRDNQDAVLLDYKYGNSKQPSASMDPYVAKDRGMAYQQRGVHGAMLRGDFLYVKWRIKSTGQVYEDTVDLRHRLPKDITDDTITFLIRGPQLYVYLVTSERRPADMPPNGPHMYNDLKVITLYPDQSKS